MWVADLIIECQKARQRKERRPRWHLNIERLLKHKLERELKQRAENIKRKRV